MKRLLTLLIIAFVFALSAPLAAHNAAAADDAATSATDNAMKGDEGGKETHHHKHKHHEKAAHEHHHHKHIGPHHAKTTGEGKTIGEHPQPDAGQ